MAHAANALVVHSEGTAHKAMCGCLTQVVKVQYTFGFLYHDSKFKFQRIPSALKTHKT